MAEPLVKLPSMLTKEVVPFTGADLSLTSGRLIENPDAILRYMSTQGERTFRLMERDPAVGNPKRKRITTTLSFGSEVVAADNSKEAKMARDFAIAFLRAIPAWRTVQRRMYDACCWGWRPLERIWNFNLEFNGRPHWGVSAIRPKDPWHFKFTIDRELAYVSTFGTTAQIFSGPAALKWIVCTSGTTDNPYGEAPFSDLWLTYIVRSQWMQQFAQGMRRSLGTLAFQESAVGSSILAETTAGGSQVKTIAEIAQELRDVIRYWDRDGLLIQKADGKLEMMTEVAFADGWEKGLRYLDEKLREGILGENIAGVKSPDGARAAAEVGERVGIDVSKADAAECEGWTNDLILRPAIEANFPDFPVDRLPRWRSKIGRGFTLADAKAFVELGGKLDARKVAAEKGLPLADEDDPDVIILERQEVPQMDPNADPEEDPKTDPRDPQKTGQKKPPPKPGTKRSTPFRSFEAIADDAEAHGEEVDADLEAIVLEAATVGSAHVKQLARSWLEANSDPKG